MDQKYIYTILAILFLSVWLVLFFARKNVRREMLLISLPGSFFGPLTDFFYFKDWWHPFTFSGSFLSVEALVTGFGIGGVAAVVYEVVFREKINQRNVTITIPHLLKVVKVFIVLFFVFALSFYVVGNSFYATDVTFLVLIIFELYRRPDLIKDSLYSGFLLVAVAVGVYATLNLIIPGWVDSIWVFKNTPKVYFLSLPIDYLVWYFLAGAGVGPLVEFIFRSKLQKYPL